MSYVKEIDWLTLEPLLEGQVSVEILSGDRGAGRHHFCIPFMP